jgi:subtilisin family serine protease
MAAGSSGNGQAIAVVDTGVDATHPFLSGKIIAEACFSQPAGNNASYCPGGTSPRTGAGSAVPCPDGALGCWHGTHVAGIAAGRHGVLSSTTGGIAPEAQIIAIQVFQRECVGSSCSILAYDSDILAALDHVYSLRNTHNIAAVNLSLGGDLYSSHCDSSLPAYKSIISNLRSVNIATIIASGNDGSANAIAAPACISDAVSVASTTKQNTISPFSNNAGMVTLLAPGSSIVSSVPLDHVSSGFATSSGTSLATPHVSGAWAILRGASAGAQVTRS